VLPDEGDRHVIEAAIRAGAQHIVTENLRDFPDAILSRFDMSAVTPDQFLASTYELYPRAATDILERMREDYDRPRFSRAEFVMDLRKHGFGRTAALYEDNT
jgi:hypothetical protein